MIDRAGVIAFAAGLMVSGGAVFADTWDLFESRCLAPLEAGGAPEVDGLERDPSLDVANSRGYRTRDGVFYTEVTAAGRVWACSAVKRASDDQVVAVQKMQARVDAGRYTSGMSGINPRLMSTDWRTPKLQVDLALLLGDTVLMAREVRK